LISISTDSQNHMREYQEENNLKFPQISDKNAEIAQMFKIDVYENVAEKNIKSKQAIPAKFLLNKSGKIVWKYIAETMTDRPSLDTILNAIRENC